MLRWLYGGAAALHHLALAVLFTAASQLVQCESARQFRLVLAAAPRRVSAAALLRCANAVRLSSRAWAALFAGAAAWWQPAPPLCAAALAAVPPAAPLAPCVRPDVRQPSRALGAPGDEAFAWEQICELAVPLRHRQVKERERERVCYCSLLLFFLHASRQKGADSARVFL